MTEYPEDFSNYPKSVAAKRADMVENDNAHIWTARDVLIETLRQLDNGTISNIECLVVAYLQLDDKKRLSSSYKQFSPNWAMSVGLLEDCKANMVQNGG